MKIKKFSRTKVFGHITDYKPSDVARRYTTMWERVIKRMSRNKNGTVFEVPIDRTHKGRAVSSIYSAGRRHGIVIRTSFANGKAYAWKIGACKTVPINKEKIIKTRRVTNDMRLIKIS